MPNNNNDEIIIFSFLIGILTFFALRERRIDTFKKRLESTNPGSNLNNDWGRVRSDFYKSYENIIKEYK